MGRLAGAFEDAIQILCGRIEALLVVGFAAKASDDDVVGSRARLHSPHRDDRQQQSAFHTTPHFLRSSHSDAGNPMRSAKTMGMFQSSLVLRTEMPASE